jgi:hypothetical protein
VDGGGELDEDRLDGGFVLARVGVWRIPICFFTLYKNQFVLQASKKIIN